MRNVVVALDKRSEDRKFETMVESKSVSSNSLDPISSTATTKCVSRSDDWLSLIAALSLSNNVNTCGDGSVFAHPSRVIVYVPVYRGNFCFGRYPRLRCVMPTIRLPCSRIWDDFVRVNMLDFVGSQKAHRVVI